MSVGPLQFQKIRYNFKEITSPLQHPSCPRLARSYAHLPRLSSCSPTVSCQIPRQSRSLPLRAHRNASPHGTLPVTMPARKRARQEVEHEDPPPPQEPSKLQKLRDTWEFASLVQYIYIFGSVVKIDEDIDVDVRARIPLSRPCRPRFPSV